MINASRYNQLLQIVHNGRSDDENHTAAVAARAHANGGKIRQWYRDNMPGGPTKAAPAIAHENSKLKDTAELAFLIWNLPAMITCPGATADCIRNCYARKAERFESVRRSRLENLKQSMAADFVDRMTAAITAKIYTKAGKIRKPYNGKKIIFRVHESGDYYSKAYMLAWFEIARRFPQVQFFSYTKSFDIFAAVMSECPANFTIRGSIWADTARRDIEFITAHNMPYYTAVPAAALADTLSAVSKSAACDCESGCGACGCMCAAAAARNIFAAIH